MKKFMHLMLATLFLAPTLRLTATQLSPPLQPGKPAPDFTAKDIEGQTVQLSDFKGQIVVIEAHESACPWTVAEYSSGAMPKLQRQLATNNVVWLILDPGLFAKSAAEKKMAPVLAKKEMNDQKMTVTHWIIDDASQSICKRYGVRVSPQMFVVNAKGVLAFTGSPDDARTLVANRVTAHNYVQQSVLELLAGKPVSTPRSRPYGCMVMYPDMSSFQLMTSGGDFN